MTPDPMAPEPAANLNAATRAPWPDAGSLRKTVRQILIFAAVGLAATAVHFCVAVLLIEAVGLSATVANGLAFCAALPVSFLGHALLTFRDTGGSGAAAHPLAPAIRFLSVAVGGFAVNQALIMILVDRMGLPHRPVLAAVLVGVAGATFLLSRFWVFARTGRGRVTQRVATGVRRFEAGLLLEENQSAGPVSWNAWVWAGVFLVSGLGLWVRLSTLGQDSLWADELYTWASAQMDYGRLLFVTFDVHPPAYVLVQKLSLGQGDSEWSLRLPSALFGLAAVIAVFLIALPRCGPLPALAGAALVMFSQKHIIHSSTARNYAMALLFCLLASWALTTVLRHLSEGRVRRWTAILAAAYVTTSTVALMTHTFAVIYFASLALVALVVFGRNDLKAALRTGLVIGVLNIPAYVLWGRWYLEARKTGSDFEWLARFDVVEALRIFAATLGPAGLPHVAVLLVLPVIGLGLVVAFRRAAPGLKVMILTMLVVYPVCLYLFSLSRPVFMERTLLVGVPGAGLALAVLLSSLRSRRSAVMLGAAMACLYGVSSIAYVLRGAGDEFYGMQNIQDFRGAIAYVSERSAPGSAVAVCETFTEPATRFYPVRSPAQVRVIKPDDRVGVVVGRWSDYFGLPSGERRESTLIIYPEGPLEGLNTLYYFDTPMFCLGRSQRVSTRLARDGFSTVAEQRFTGVTVRTFRRASGPVPAA